MEWYAHEINFNATSHFLSFLLGGARCFCAIMDKFFPIPSRLCKFQRQMLCNSARFYLWFYRYMFRCTWSRRSVTAKRVWKQKASLRRAPIIIKPWIEMERWKIKLDNTQKEIPEAMRACNKVFSNISSPPRWLLGGGDELLGLRNANTSSKWVTSVDRPGTLFNKTLLLFSEFDSRASRKRN